MKILYPYQQKAIDNTKIAWDRGIVSSMIHLFTGAGKTLIALKMIEQLIDLEVERVLFIAPARSIVTQTAAEFMTEYPALMGTVMIPTKSGLAYNAPALGVAMAEQNDVSARVIVGSAQSLISRAEQSKSWVKLTKDDVEPTEFGGWRISDPLSLLRPNIVSSRFDEILEYGIPSLVIHDECHHSIADGTMAKMIRLWELCDLVGVPRTKLVGFTATPFREDQRALNNLFQAIIIRRDFIWGIKNQYLTPLAEPIRVLAQVGGSTASIFKVEDWKERLLEAYLDKCILDSGEPRAFIGVMPDVESSIQITRYFNRNNIPVAHIDGEKIILPSGERIPTSQRADIFRRFAKQEFWGLFNYGVLNEGVNLPYVSAILWGRDTENSVLFTQTVGRGLRLWGGNSAWSAKEDCVLIDFTGRELSMLTSGTLSGEAYDPFVEKINIEDDDEDELILDNVDMRDIQISSGLVEGRGDNIYTVAQILRKSEGDFYHDSVNNVFSLSVTPTDSLLITSPIHTLAFAIEPLLDTEDIHELSYLNKVYEVFSKYCLWHLKKTTNNQYGVVGGEYVATEETVDVLLGDAMVYSYQNIDLTQANFMVKNQSWKRRPMTEKQSNYVKILASKAGIEVDDNMTARDASKLINHLKIWPYIYTIRLNMYKKIKDRL